MVAGVPGADGGCSVPSVLAAAFIPGDPVYLMMFYLPRLLSLGPSPPSSVWGTAKGQAGPWQFRVGVHFSRKRVAPGLAPAVLVPAEHRHSFQDSRAGLLQPPWGLWEQCGGTEHFLGTPGSLCAADRAPGPRDIQMGAARVAVS